MADCSPQALHSAGIGPSKLEIVFSNAMVEGGVSGHRGSNVGDATRKQQMAVENVILDAVKKNQRIGGIGSKWDEGAGSFGVGLEHIKFQVSVADVWDVFRSRILWLVWYNFCSTLI